MNYVTIASTFSGNKGAASMLEASIQTISKKDPGAKFSVFTIYPEEDKKFNSYSNVTIYSAKPFFLGAVLNPLTLVYKIIPPLRPLLRLQKHIKALSEADVMLDQGGITFVDGRAKFLIYNVATLLPGTFTNTRIVKCSQAMGPFNTKINRITAKLILPYIDTICARGAMTREYLQDLGLRNVIESTDYAFLMNISRQEARQADRLLESHKPVSKSKLVVVMPSEVVRKKAEASGQDYVTYNREFINYILSKGHQVFLMAYSAREKRDTRHNNDLPVCRDIALGIEHNNFRFIDHELSAQKLRSIIGKADILVTSRFHAMIAALAMATPPLVVGWSHKYAEIMDMFGLKDSALDSKELDLRKLQQVFIKLLKHQNQTKALIRRQLPAVKRSAEKQVKAILGR